MIGNTENTSGKVELKANFKEYRIRKQITKKHL